MASVDVGGGRRVVVPNGAGFAPRSTNGEVLMATDVAAILAGLARLEERVVALDARLAAVTTSSVTRHELLDVERRVGVLEAGASRLVWMVLTSVVTALLGLVVGAGVMGG